MARLVIPIQSEIALGAHDVSEDAVINTAGDGYATRVTKYIPGEILAAYVSIGGVVSGIDDHQKRLVIAWIVFSACFLSLPFYLSKMADKRQPKRLHIFISLVAFTVWAYAIGGAFINEPWHDSIIGSVALGLFTLVSGLFSPQWGDK